MSDLREKIARAVRQAVMEMAAVGEAPFSERMAAYTEAVNYSADAILALIAPSPDTASTSLVLGGNGSYSAEPDRAVHRVCPYVAGNGEDECLKCEPWEDHPKFGKVKRGCYSLAESVVRIALSDSASGEAAADAATEGWRL